jgi:hypothetical protein
METRVAFAGTQRPGSPPAGERRAFERHACHPEAPRPAAAPRAGAWRARLFNVSAAGVGLVLARPFEAGTVLAIDLPGASAGPRTSLARVIHATPGPAGEWLVGGVFLRQLDADTLRAGRTGPVRPGETGSGVWVRVAADMPTADVAVAAEPAGAVRPHAPQPAPEPDPDLARLCSAWPALPGPTKAAILALVAATP